MEEEDEARDPAEDPDATGVDLSTGARDLTAGTPGRRVVAGLLQLDRLADVVASPQARLGYG